MGRVNNPPPPAAQAATPPSSTLKHFTHPHDLHPLSFYNPQTLCSGCQLQSSGIMYTCTPCNFILHKSCATLPQLITHPSHGGCTLSLLTLSSYPGGVFSCNACARRSNSWNYHCAACEFDLHVTCASKPLKTRHLSHASCDLDLTFKNPYVNSNGFSCDICRKIGSKQWLYRCNSCEFDVHLDCTAVQQPVLQHQHSAPPVVAPLYHNQLMHNQFPGSPAQLHHSVSTGAIQNPQAANMYHQGQPYAGNPQMMTMQNNNKPANSSGMGGNLMAAAFQGFVEGAFQGVGQAVVQEVIGDSGNAGGGADAATAGDSGDGETYSY